MAYDKIYYFDKINHRRYELGEIQTNFNLNIVIDGDKDSMQIDVHSYSRDALQPNTIIYHANDPLQWFVVKKDNVKRNANEKGFYYIHSITINGAIDLTKNRDLTDCGFNANGYTIDEFFKKLLKLSNFEFDYEIDYGNNVDKDKKVDYIKSYENYTLLTAIRDLFNGYNCDVKLGFQTFRIAGYTTLTKAIFKIIPRTGNIDLTPIDISEFNDIRESINFDKESYGTTVISNAQNVVSTLAKTFPQVGGVRVTGSDYETNINSAYIKLPSPAWKVNWVKASSPSRATMTLQYASGDETIQIVVRSGTHYIYEPEKFYEELLNGARNTQGFTQQDKEKIIEKKDEIIEFCKMFSVSFYNNPTYNPRLNAPVDTNNGSFIKEENTPYIPLLGPALIGHQVALVDKESASLVKNQACVIIWERGSDKITNLQGILNNQVLSGLDTQLVSQYNRLIFSVANNRFISIVMNNATSTQPAYPTGNPYLFLGEVVFQVNYIPMSDIKIKQDNENNNNDIQLYNQNGKLNDSVALSKMVDSYSKEITNPTITRYGEYYNLNDIPQIGQIVMDGNNKYVINNISYNLYPCESDDEDEVNYYCECEFTLAEFISTKSIMTSPNTNVRDYGIPQKYNVKRRQVYRDYYEFGFSYETLANQETPYAKLENYLQLSDSATPKDFDHTALIKIDYEQEVSGQTSWYYQLNSTAYTMAKSVYEIIDFDDNNIIGYDIANSTTGFNMSDLWSNQYRAVTTPVSYVDDNGKFVGITLQMTGKEALEQAYSQINTDNNPVMFSAHCFINSEIYNLVAYPLTPKTTQNINRETNFDISENPFGDYFYSFNLNKSDLGIPENAPNYYISINSDKSVQCNGNELDATKYSLSINNIYDDGTMQILFEPLDYPVVVFGSNTGTLSFSFKINYRDITPLSDYIIDEPNYNKDPIEVPVFEYSLQFGDTKEVEVGDNILKNNVGMLSFYTAVVVDKNTATPLNASKWFEGLSVSGDTYSDPNNVYDCMVEIANPNYVNFALEDDNKKLRIKFFTNNITALFYGIESTDSFSLQSIEKGSTRKPKSQLVDKDIIIYRHTIKSMTYDSSEEESTCEYDTELMYIIHAPQDAQFDNDDLVLCLNYYKLK